MIGFLRKLLGFGPKTDYPELVRQGAWVIDVRTSGEFSLGHVKGARNIDLNTIKSGKHALKDKHKALILCCQSGMRSAEAKSSLQKQGFTQVYNAGGWQSLRSKIS